MHITTDKVDFLPHGIDTSVFYPRNYRAARNGFGEKSGAKSQKGKPIVIPSDCLMVGIIATNQTRKDFGLGVEAVAELAKNQNILLWIHSDVLERHWSFAHLLEDFNFKYETAVITASMEFTDDQMAWMYSACDVTLGIGNAEGFGFPIFESLACGTPCIHGRDGGAAEHMPDYMLVDPVARRLEGIYNCYRAVYRVEDWVKKVQNLPKRTGESLLPAHLDWINLWPSWSEWFTKGLASVG